MGLAPLSTDDSFHDPAVSHLPELTVSDLHFRPQRRTLLPLMLFLATCASTFWVGVTHWEPLEPRYIGTYAAMGRIIQTNWVMGVQYMVAVLAILLTHEMGHFLQTVKNRIPASYPLCIPIPFNAIGTMGAVIGMDGMRADRRQIFDIGIAGPLAGSRGSDPRPMVGHHRFRSHTHSAARRVSTLSPLDRPVDA